MKSRLGGVMIYGGGHLAETLSRAPGVRGLREVDDVVCAELLFVAEDVLDHADAEQLEAVGSYFRQAAITRSTYVPVVVVSQVPPGWTRLHVAGRDNIFYQVDTIIVRRAVERVVHPEQFIVGCADPSLPLPLAYQEYLAAHDCPVLQMSYESAELAKCAINYHLATQVRTANELKHAADRVGADYDQVARALAGDARIGPHAYLRPGEINQHLRRDVETISNLCSVDYHSLTEGC